MTEYFEEKSTQVVPEKLEAFGIQVFSRYGKAWELIEMLKASEEMAERQVHGYIASMFYDSKACICSFEFSDEEPSPDTNEMILSCLLNHVSQFEWEGIVHHGGSLAASEHGA